MFIKCVWYFFYVIYTTLVLHVHDLKGIKGTYSRGMHLRDPLWQAPGQGIRWFIV